MSRAFNLEKHMPVEIFCEICRKPFKTNPARVGRSRFCSRGCRGQAERNARVEFVCEVCEKPFLVTPSRAARCKPKYCGKTCANTGQPRNRIVWCKGLTKETEPRIAEKTEKRRRTCEEKGLVKRGAAHHSFGRKASPETIEKLRAAGRARVITLKMLENLACGREAALIKLKGQTKETSPSIARRAQILSEKYKGTKRPGQAERARKKIQEDPDLRRKLIDQLNKVDDSKKLERLREVCQSSEHRNKLSVIFKGRKNPKTAEGLKKFFQDPENRRRSSERMKAYLTEHPEKHILHILRQRGHETSLERAMRLALTEAGISFEAQYRIGRYFADFAIIEYRIVIEVDGDYWHGEEQAERDARRDAFMISQGWRVLRFNEKRVIKNLVDCLLEIQQAIAA